MIYIIDEVHIKDGQTEAFLRESKSIRDHAAQAAGHVKSVLLSTDVDAPAGTDDIVADGPNTFVWVCEWESYNHYTQWMQDVGDTDEGKAYMTLIENRTVKVLENKI